MNEANAASFPVGYRKWLEYAKGPQARPHTSRYVGMLVAHSHRTLLRGGVLVDPPTRKGPEGKLQLLHEACTMEQS